MSGENEICRGINLVGRQRRLGREPSDTRGLVIVAVCQSRLIEVEAVHWQSIFRLDEIRNEREDRILSKSHRSSKHRLSRKKFCNVWAMQRNALNQIPGETEK